MLDGMLEYPGQEAMDLSEEVCIDFRLGVYFHFLK